MDNIKPGWKTTEFWMAIAHQFIIVGTLVGVIKVSDASQLEGSIVYGISAVAALAASAYSISTYIKGRSSLKQSAQGDAASA